MSSWALSWGDVAGRTAGGRYRAARIASPQPAMQFGVFYQLPCAPGQSVPRRYRDTLAQAEYAERLDFDSVWLAEAHFDAGFSAMPTPLVVAAALSGRTRRIRLGIGVS